VGVAGCVDVWACFVDCLLVKHLIIDGVRDRRNFEGMRDRGGKGRGWGWATF